MPNWIMNKILLTGIENKKELFKENKFSLNSIIPEPQTEDECDLEYLISKNDNILPIEGKPWYNWYKWRKDNWGTKWEINDTSIEENSIMFWTANAPISSNIVKILSEMYHCKVTHLYCVDYIDENAIWYDTTYNNGRFVFLED